MGAETVYTFGDLRFEPANLRLVHAGGEIPLTGRAVETLVVLVERPDTVVSKEELLNLVWPGVAVEENNLTQQVSALRRALALARAGDRIETVPRRGYRFRGPVVAVAVPVGPVSAEARSDTSSPGLAVASTPRADTWLKRALVAVLVAVVAGAVGWGLYQSVRQLSEGEAAFARGNELLERGEAAAAVDELQRAIALDPENARAYGVLAHALNRVSARAAIPAPDGRSPSVQAAARAVEIDPTCGQCQGTFGLFLFAHAWDWPRAERHLVEAVRLEPDLEAIRPSYALLLATSGRLEEALAQIDFALNRRPYDVGWLVIRASILYLSRRYDEAVTAADQALLIDDTNRGAWDWRSKALFQLGRGDEAVNSLSHAALAPHAETLDRAVRDGGTKGALRALVALTDGPLTRTEHSWRRGAWLAQLGEADGAVGELERAVEARLFNVIYFGVDPAYDNLRGHPRFVGVLRRLGLDVALAPAVVERAPTR